METRPHVCARKTDSRSPNLFLGNPTNMGGPSPPTGTRRSHKSSAWNTACYTQISLRVLTYSSETSPEHIHKLRGKVTPIGIWCFLICHPPNLNPPYPPNFIFIIIMIIIIIFDYYHRFINSSSFRFQSAHLSSLKLIHNHSYHHYHGSSLHFIFSCLHQSFD